MSDRREHDFATRELAEQLYVFRGLTYAEISKESGVSETQLKRWGKTGDWREKREQYLTSNAQQITRLIGIRDHALDKLESELQPNTAHQLFSVWRDIDKFIRSETSPAGADVDHPALFLEHLRFIVETLKRIDPPGVKVIADNYDALIVAFKERHASQ